MQNFFVRSNFDVARKPPDISGAEPDNTFARTLNNRSIPKVQSNKKYESAGPTNLAKPAGQLWPQRINQTSFEYFLSNRTIASKTEKQSLQGAFLCALVGNRPYAQPPDMGGVDVEAFFEPAGCAQ